MKRITLLLALGLVSALVLAACGGDDDGNGQENGGDPVNTPAAGETPAGNTPTNGGEQPTNTPPPDSGNGGDAGSELADLIANISGRTFEATYEVTTTMEGTEQTGTARIAQDPPRYATVMELSGGTLAIIADESGTYSCFGAGTFGTCSRAAGEQGSVFDLRDVTEDTGDLASYNQVEDRDINGRDSRCWQGTDDESGVEQTFCIAKGDGFLTYTSAGGFEMILTDLSESVDEDVFELPFPVQ